MNTTDFVIVALSALAGGGMAAGGVALSRAVRSAVFAGYTLRCFAIEFTPPAKARSATALSAMRVPAPDWTATSDLSASNGEGELTRAEAAALLGYEGERTVRRLGSQGLLTEIHHPGRPTTVTAESVRQLQQQREASS